MTNADVNYEIKLSEDFSRTAKGFDSSCSSKTLLITRPAFSMLKKKKRSTKNKLLTLVIGSTLRTKKGPKELSLIFFLLSTSVILPWLRI